MKYERSVSEGKEMILILFESKFHNKNSTRHVLFTISNSIQAVLQNFHFSIAETCLKHDKKYISMYFLLRGISY